MNYNHEELVECPQYARQVRWETSSLVKNKWHVVNLSMTFRSDIKNNQKFLPHIRPLVFWAHVLVLRAQQGTPEEE